VAHYEIMAFPFYFRPGCFEATQEVLEADIGIYGANAAGVVAALQARRMGLSSVVCEPLAHVGGLTAGGLSFTDMGSRAAIGGLSRQFYRECGKYYGAEEEWKFEPRVASQVLAAWLAESRAELRLRQFIAGVEKDAGNAVREVRFLGGRRVRARVWLDCSYEGDLLAMAGASFHVGREDNAAFEETLNGAQVKPKHQFDFDIDPFGIEGDAASGLLPQIENEIPRIGEGDRRVQAYNFRLCLSSEPGNQRPWEKPEGYDGRQYELLARYFKAGWKEAFHKFDPIRGRKCDMNNHGAVSSDFVGASWEYPTASYERREQIFQAHLAYQRGLMWFRAHSEQSPAWVRDRQDGWKLPLDEFGHSEGWPPQLYVREARRLMSARTVTEHDCKGAHDVEDAVGMASYTMDSHNCTRFAEQVGGKWRVRNEGDVQVGVQPYRISRRSIEPHQSECPNLLVPVCLSASHIAYGSARMEPVFMLLAQSAAIVAALAAGAQSAVQQVPYRDIEAVLRREGQVLEV